MVHKPPRVIKGTSKRAARRLGENPDARKDAELVRERKAAIKKKKMEKEKKIRQRKAGPKGPEQ